MDKKEKQVICKNILKKIINLRATLCNTNRIYTKCKTAIADVWDKGLAEYIDNKFYNPVIEKYSEIYKKNCATLASIPIKINSPYKIEMISLDSMTFFTAKNKTPSALLWCGIGRAEINNHTGFESVTVVKLQDVDMESDKIVYCKTPHVLESYNFIGLIHLLKNGEYKEEKSCLSEVSRAFLDASINLKDFSFRKKIEIKIKTSEDINEKDFEILEKILNSKKVEKEIKKLEIYDAKMYHYDYSLMIEELYENLNIDLESFSNTDLINKYDLQDDSLRLPHFTIDLTSSAKFVDANRDKDNGPAFWVGNNAGGLMGRYKNLIGTNIVAGLVVAYIVLMSDMTDEGLREIEKVISEAKKQYFSYLNTMLSIIASFNTQMLTSYL